MSNIDKVIKMTNGAIKNHQGGVAYEKSFEDTLIEFFSLGLLNGNYYQTQEDVLKYSKELFETALKTCPEFATKCAVYGNHTNSMKLVPTVWLVYLSTLEDKELFRSAFPLIIRNPKMLHDFMEISRKAGIRNGLGRVTKKAINSWLGERLNEYQVSRNAGKLNDVIKVTRPKPTSEEMSNYFQYISKGELTFNRAQALSVVRETIGQGKLTEEVYSLINGYNIQLEEVKFLLDKLDKKDKQDLFQVLYQKLNYTALILNLVALERVYATKLEPSYGYRNGQHYVTTAVTETNIPDEVIDMVVSKIVDYDAYRKSNMLPFAILNASKMVVTPEFKSALDKVFSKMAKESFKLDPNESIMVAVDTSGSMTNRVTDRLSAVDIASLFGAMIKKSHNNSNILAVASMCECVELKSQSDIFTMSNEIVETKVGHGTYFEAIMPKYNGEKYVILITDSEQAGNLEREWKKANKPKGAKLIVWQLLPYGHDISKDSSVVHIAGYSDRLLGLIKDVIEGKSAQREDIDNIDLRALFASKQKAV